MTPYGSPQASPQTMYGKEKGGDGDGDVDERRDDWTELLSADIGWTPHLKESSLRSEHK